jgi:hypothetical protein
MLLHISKSIFLHMQGVQVSTPFLDSSVFLLRRFLSCVPSEHSVCQFHLFSSGVVFSPALLFCFQRLLLPVSSPRLQVTEAFPPLLQPLGKGPQSHRRLLISLLHLAGWKHNCISPVGSPYEG